MREFRFLDEKRKTTGLTAPEEQRWQELGSALGIDLSAAMQPAGYYGPDGLWYQYPPGYDPNLAWQQQQQWQQQQYYPPQQPQQPYYDPNTGAYYPQQQQYPQQDQYAQQYGQQQQGYYDPNTGAYYPPEAWQQPQQQQPQWDANQQQWAYAQQPQPEAQQWAQPQPEQQWQPEPPAPMPAPVPAYVPPVATKPAFIPPAPRAAEPPLKPAPSAPVFVPPSFATLNRPTTKPVEAVEPDEVMEISDEEVLEVPVTAPPPAVTPMRPAPQPMSALDSVDELRGALIDEEDAAPMVRSGPAGLFSNTAITRLDAATAAALAAPSLDELTRAEADSGLVPVKDDFTTPLADVVEPLSTQAPTEVAQRLEPIEDDLSFTFDAPRPAPVEPPPSTFTPSAFSPTFAALEVASEPSVEAPSLDSAPVAIEPSVELPSFDAAPVAIEPSVELPSFDVAPVAIEPSVEVPSFDAAPIEPSVEVPSFDVAPVTIEPSVEVPSFDAAPVAIEPSVEVPSFDAAPVAVEPSVEVPSFDAAPVAVEPSVEVPSFDAAPVAVEPSVEVSPFDAAPVASVEVSPSFAAAPLAIESVEVSPFDTAPVSVEVRSFDEPVAIEPSVTSFEVAPAVLEPTVEVSSFDTIAPRVEVPSTSFAPRPFEPSAPGAFDALPDVGEVAVEVPVAVEPSPPAPVQLSAVAPASFETAELTPAAFEAPGLPFENNELTPAAFEPPVAPTAARVEITTFERPQARSWDPPPIDELPDTSPALLQLKDVAPLEAPPPQPELPELDGELEVEAPTQTAWDAPPVPTTSSTSAFDLLAMPPESAPRIPTFTPPAAPPPPAAAPVPHRSEVFASSWENTEAPVEINADPSVFAASWSNEEEEAPLLTGTIEPELSGHADDKIELASTNEFLPAGTAAETEDISIDADAGDFVVESATAAELATNVRETATAPVVEEKLELASNSDFIDNSQLTSTGNSWSDDRTSIAIDDDQESEEVIQGTVLEEDPAPEAADSWGMAVAQPSPVPQPPPPAPPPVAVRPVPPPAVAVAAPPRVATPLPPARVPPLGGEVRVSVPAPVPPPVAPAQTAPLAPVVVPGDHRVILHTVEGQVKRGAIKDARLGEPQLNLQLANGGAETLARERVKALFFMLAPGARAPTPEGNKVRVTFKDGRQVAGFSKDHRATTAGFFVVPADNRTNTERIFIFRHAVQSIAVEG